MAERREEKARKKEMRARKKKVKVKKADDTTNVNTGNISTNTNSSANPSLHCESESDGDGKSKKAPGNAKKNGNGSDDDKIKGPMIKKLLAVKPSLERIGKYEVKVTFVSGNEPGDAHGGTAWRGSWKFATGTKKSHLFNNFTKKVSDGEYSKWFPFEKALLDGARKQCLVYIAEVDWGRDWLAVEDPQCYVMTENLSVNGGLQCKELKDLIYAECGRQGGFGFRVCANQRFYILFRICVFTSF